MIKIAEKKKLPLSTHIVGIGIIICVIVFFIFLAINWEATLPFGAVMWIVVKTVSYISKSMGYKNKWK